MLYINGTDGIVKNLPTGIQWCLKAAENGSDQARKNLEAVRIKGHGSLIDAQQHQALVEKKAAAQREQERQALTIELNSPSMPLRDDNSFKLPERPQKNEQSAVQAVDLPYSLPISYAEISLTKELGRGGFGVVYQGTWRHVEVAVKKVALGNSSRDGIEAFQQEMAIMAKLHAPNIVQLYGACQEPGFYCIVMQYMPKGSLYSVLHSNLALDWTIRQQIAIDMGCGLVYLHHEKILHRDLKSLNVLLDDQLHAKLSDFGLSTLKTESRSTTQNMGGAGTLAWMAPELFQRRAVYTEKADIYSYGMTVWEILSRETPFKVAQDPALIPQWVKDGEREDIPVEAPPKLAQLVKWCWEAKPEARPTADQIVTLLKTEELVSGPVYQDNWDSSNSLPQYLSN